MFKGRIRDVFEDFIDSLVYLDPDSFISELIERLIESRAVVTRRDLDSIIKAFKDKAYFGPACVIVKLASKISFYKGGPSLLEALMRLSRIYEEQYDRIYSALNGFLGYEESIGTIGYSKGLLDSILYSRSKVKVVYALESYPIRSGKMLVSELRREGVKAYYIPDEAVLWVASKASKVLVPVYGSTSDGYTVVEPGGFALATVAKEVGIPVVGIYLPVARCVSVDSSLIKRDNELSISKKFNVKVAPFDIVKPKYYDVFVTHDGVVKASEEIMKELSGLVDQVIKAVIG